MFAIRFYLCWALLLLFCGSDAFAFEYAWLTDTEARAFGDPMCWGEELDYFEPIRSNSAICVCGPTHNYFITADTICGNPEFLDEQPVVRAAAYPFPDSLGYLRWWAAQWGANIYVEGRSWFVEVQGGSFRYHSYPTGDPIDTLQNPHWVHIDLVGWNMAVFFNGPLQIKGYLSGRLIVGCSHDIEIPDNLTYTDANPDGVVPNGSVNYLVLASERNIIVRNTPRNGRENCNGGGRDNPNRNECGIVISAQLIALNGSFTFEDQNDADSGYVCSCVPDERGYIHLFGSVAQRQAGYMHRSNNGGTGYVMDYRFDSRALLNQDLVFYPPTQEQSTDTLDFGEIVLGETASDTAHVYRYYDYQYYGAYATFPFVLGQVTPTFGNHFRLPLRFTPSGEGNYSGVLTVLLEGDPIEIVIRGRGVRSTAADEISELTPHELLLNVSPNPFNSQAEIRYELPVAEAAFLRLYDTLGRIVREWSLGSERSGTIHFDAKDLSSGLYFIGLSQNTRFVTQKLLHIK